MVIVDSLQRDVGFFKIIKLQTILESHHKVVLFIHVQLYGDGFGVMDVVDSEISPN